MAFLQLGRKFDCSSKMDSNLCEYHVGGEEARESNQTENMTRGTESVLHWLTGIIL